MLCTFFMLSCRVPGGQGRVRRLAACMVARPPRAVDRSAQAPPGGRHGLMGHPSSSVAGAPPQLRGQCATAA
jgi:hypothetical protein